MQLWCLVLRSARESSEWQGTFSLTLWGLYKEMQARYAGLQVCNCRYTVWWLCTPWYPYMRCTVVYVGVWLAVTDPLRVVQGDAGEVHCLTSVYTMVHLHEVYHGVCESVTSCHWPSEGCTRRRRRGILAYKCVTVGTLSDECVHHGTPTWGVPWCMWECD